MKNPAASKTCRRFFNLFAVLATEGDGQPHTSLIAVTPTEGYRKLIPLVHSPVEEKK